MSARSIIGGTLRGLLIATATAGAAFGALVIFEPFGRPAEPAPAATSTSPASRALQQRIEDLRLSLRATEQEIATAATSSTREDSAMIQLRSQLAAATERRDLARRHAEAIRKSLDAGATPSSLAEIRDSVVIGQLLTQQATLDAQIAIDSARLRANHPTMRALTAQRAALARQIRQEAADIAAALESEAKIDDAQIDLLQSELPSEGAAMPADTVSLEAQAAAQRSELDALVDTYFDIPAPANAVPAAIQRNDLSVANLAVVSAATLIALLAQVSLAARRARRRRQIDLAKWRSDPDPSSVPAAEQTVEPQRKAA